MNYVRSLAEVRLEDASLVGGKAASLGELLHHRLSVPEGFALLATAHDTFRDKPLPQSLINQLHQSFDVLGAERVAVRSSALDEDTPGKSSAGLYETFLNVPRDQLIPKLLACWQSVAADRVAAYAAGPSSVGVVVQRMLNPSAAGVIFTTHPVIRATDQMLVEAVYGLGEPLVQGQVTPDSYTISRPGLTFLSQDISNKPTMLTWKQGRQQEVGLPPTQRTQPVLNLAQLVKLAKLALRAEHHYGVPLDIEWAFEGPKLYLLQARPITTL